MYALTINADNRILSACIALPATPASLPRVDDLPEGDINDWLFVDNEFVYDPLPRPDPPTPEPTADEIIDALLGVTE